VEEEILRRAAGADGIDAIEKIEWRSTVRKRKLDIFDRLTLEKFSVTPDKIVIN
jgi:hypothetical protein